MAKIKNEPVAVANAIGGLIMALIMMLVELNAFSLTPAQIDAVRAFVYPMAGVVLYFGSTLYGRSKVSPVKK